jgi:hypothetical protein
MFSPCIFVIFRSKRRETRLRGEKQTSDEEKTGDVLYKGIAERTFERSFQLADHVLVKSARLENGLLHVDPVREIPEAMKPRAIPIASSGKVLEVQPNQGRRLTRQPVEIWECPGFLGRFRLGTKLREYMSDDDQRQLGLGKSASRKMMASDDKKVKTNSAPEHGAPPEKKSTSGAEPSKAGGGELAGASPSGYTRGEGQKPVSEAYRNNWNVIFAGKRKR